MPYIFNDLLISLLLFMLIFLVVFQAMKRAFKDKSIAGVIALAISAISVFYMSYAQIDLTTKIYGFTGTIILMSIPFAIAFLFIYSSNIGPTVRKMFWVFYSIITIIIWQNYITTNIDMQSITTIFVFFTIVLLLLDKIIKNKFSAMRNLRRR